MVLVVRSAMAIQKKKTLAESLSFFLPLSCLVRRRKKKPQIEACIKRAYGPAIRLATPGPLGLNHVGPTSQQRVHVSNRVLGVNNKLCMERDNKLLAPGSSR